MKITLASTDDIDQLSTLFDKYRVFYGQESNLSLAADFLKKRIENEESIVFFALDDSQKCVGFVQLYPSFSSIGVSRTFILNDLYILESHRNKNIASQLIKAAHAYAASKKAVSISLQTSKNNLAAQNLYAKLGYKLEVQFDTYTKELH